MEGPRLILFYFFISDDDLGTLDCSTEKVRMQDCSRVLGHSIRVWLLGEMTPMFPLTFAGGGVGSVRLFLILSSL